MSKLRTSTSVALPLALRRVRERELAALKGRERRRARWSGALSWASQDAPLALALVVALALTWALLR